MAIVKRQHDGLVFPVICKCNGCGRLYDVTSPRDFDYGMVGDMPTKAEADCPDCGHDLIPVDEEDVSDLIRQQMPSYMD